jgi:hypothetical protein
VRIIVTGGAIAAMAAVSMPASAAPASAGAASATAPTAAVSPAAKTYKNCTALNKKYPHGVGKSSKVRDRDSQGKSVRNPVTNFRVSKALYLANKKSDRDGDGIACEKL